MYELVFRRKLEAEQLEQVRCIHPESDEFATKDLWTKYASKAGLWRYTGRTDDLIVLLYGEGLYTSDLETEMRKYPDVMMHS